jgi:hypothetical protein
LEFECAKHDTNDERQARAVRMKSRKLEYRYGQRLIANLLTSIAIAALVFSIGPRTHASEIATAGPQCETTGATEVTISCSYSASAAQSAQGSSTPRVVLDRAVISFAPSKESHMRIELTFTNDTDAKIAERRTVYLAFDNAKGENQMRRPLRHVDFTKLEPGRPMKFEEILLAPGFKPGLYTISLWIPSNEDALKFNPAHNFLLSDDGVQDAESGLNRIAKFTATASPRQKSSKSPD